MLKMAVKMEREIAGTRLLKASIYWMCQSTSKLLNDSVKEPNKFHNFLKLVSDAAEYIELFGSSTRDHHARRINVIH